MRSLLAKDLNHRQLRLLQQNGSQKACARQKGGAKGGNDPQDSHEEDCWQEIPKDGII